MTVKGSSLVYIRLEWTVTMSTTLISFATAMKLILFLLSIEMRTLIFSLCTTLFSLSRSLSATVGVMLFAFCKTLCATSLMRAQPQRCG